MKRTYVIIGYKTTLDYFTLTNGEIISEGITKKREAMNIYNSNCNSGKFAYIKLKCSDNEFIDISDCRLIQNT